MNLIDEKRAQKRFVYEATIWHDNLFPDIFYETKMYNLSQGGLYFESDQILYVGEQIFIAIREPSASDNDYKDCFKVEIRWSKNLKKSLMRYGYGAQFVDSHNTLLESIDTAGLSLEPLPDSSHTDSNDSRQNARSPYRKVTFFTTRNRSCKGFITNVSRAGAFVITKEKLPLQERITMIIPGGAKRGDLRLNACVVRLSPKGIGVKFDRRTLLERREGRNRRQDRRSTAGAES